MEEAWKQSSVALGFRGVLISICSSETRGIRKPLCRRRSHLQISDFIYVSFLFIYHIDVFYLWFHITYNDWLESERLVESVSPHLLTKSLHLLPLGHFLLVSFCSGIHNGTKGASVTLLRHLCLQVAALQSMSEQGSQKDCKKIGMCTEASSSILVSIFVEAAKLFVCKSGNTKIILEDATLLSIRCWRWIRWVVDCERVIVPCRCWQVGKIGFSQRARVCVM